MTVAVGAKIAIGIEKAEMGVQITESIKIYFQVSVKMLDPFGESLGIEISHTGKEMYHLMGESGFADEFEIIVVAPQNHWHKVAVSGNNGVFYMVRCDFFFCGIKCRKFKIVGAAQKVAVDIKSQQNIRFAFKFSIINGEAGGFA